MRQGQADGRLADEKGEGVPIEWSQTTWLFMQHMGRRQYLQVHYNTGRNKGDRSKKRRKKRRKMVLLVTDCTARMGTKKIRQILNFY